jgi:hypothetical protein
VIAYLKRAKQMRWQEADLKSACLFSEVVNDARLRKELLDKGEKKFPGNPCFAIWSAIDEIRELSNRRRRGSIYAASQILAGLCAKVEAALAKARAAAPRDERLIELGETLLADLQHAKEVLSPPLPFFAWDDDDDDEDEDDEYGAYDDDEFEEESDDAGRFAGMPLDMGGMKAMFDDVMRTMPAEIKAEIERVAAEQGMTPQESFLAFLKAGVPADFAGIPFPDSPPKRPRRSRRD